MKVVQTTLTEAEHKLLEEYAKKNSMSIKDVLREAVRTTLAFTEKGLPNGAVWSATVLLPNNNLPTTIASTVGNRGSDTLSLSTAYLIGLNSI